MKRYLVPVIVVLTLSTAAHAQRVLTLLEPDAGDAWVSGDQTIQWERTGSGWTGTDTIHIEYSANSGGSWTTIDASADATADQYTWSVDGLTAGVFYRIRITCNEDTSATDESGDFRVGANLNFYVNDDSTVNDVYTTAIGNDANDGLTPGTPKASVREILITYDLEGGDTVWVDTGTYVDTSIGLGTNDDGTNGNPVRIVGSPHPDGTTLDRNDRSCSPLFPGPTHVVSFNGYYHRIERLRITGACYGVEIRWGAGAEVVGCEIFGNRTGIYQTTQGAYVANNLIRDNTGAQIQVWYPSNWIAATYSSNTLIGRTCISIAGNEDFGGNIINNIFWAQDGGICLSMPDSAFLDPFGRSDYNDFYVTDGAIVGRYNDVRWPTLGEWRDATGKDGHSISTDPLFVDPGNGDYHLSSTKGSWHGETWLPDVVTSPCVDGSNPASDFSNEPAPNGSQRNMGAYGNTSEASLTPSERSIMLVDPCDGVSWMSGDHEVSWRRFGTGWTGTETVRIEYSPDAGTSWVTLTPSVQASAETSNMNVNSLTPGPLYQLRITCVEDPSATHTSANFRIGSNLSFYVNDGSTTNDVHTTTVGDDANDGVTPGTPKASLQAILDTYNLEPRDTVYMDTGTYVLTDNILVTSSDGGTSGNPLTILGSSHADGTTVDRNDISSSSGIEITGSYVSIKSVRVTGAQMGIRISGDGVEVNSCELFENAWGLYVPSGSATVVNSLIRENSEYGMYTSSGSSVAAVVNNTIVDNGLYEAYFRNTFSSTAVFKNNVVCADGAGKYCVYFYGSYYIDSGADWDFNDLYATGGAAVGYYGDATQLTLGDWQGVTGKDENSLSVDPLFLDAGNDDYHLQIDSPCLDAGANSGAPLEDIDGDRRPYNVLTDMGADEGGTPSVPVVEVTPVSPYSNDPLVCTVTVPTILLPGFTPHYEYTWSNADLVVVYGPTTDETHTLSSVFTEKHETWTCAVRGHDGIDTYSDPAEDSTTVINTEPSELKLYMPEFESTRVSLRCYLDKSPDPDSDVEYEVQWEYTRNDITLPWDGDVWTTDLFTQIDAADTVADDIWKCEVTYQDDETIPVTAEAVCLIVPGGVTDSSISLTFDGPNAVALGESITVKGLITPVPSGNPNATFESTSPSGVVSDLFPEGTVVSGGGYVKTFVPTEASERREPWRLTASWPGDDTYMPATSDEVAFSVNKAQPTLSLELSHSSATLNFDQLTAWAELTAPVPAELSSLLSGQTVKLWMKKPDATAAGPVTGTTDGDGVAEFTAADFASAGIVFDMAGTWQFLAEFEGDDNFLQATSTDYDDPESVRLTIKDRAGYAVIVVGKLDDDGEGHDSHAKTGDYVYRAFRDRGFAEEDIYYLCEGPVQPAPDIYVDDTTPTQSDVQWTIESWALGKMNAAAAPLYVVFLDHGGRDKFYVYSGSYGDTREITPGELDGYFDTLQASLDAEAEDEDIVLIYGACHSGSFIQAVSGDHRVIITSTSAGEVSHRGVIDPDDGIRDGEVLVTELFRNASTGKTLKQSFELASEKTAEYTASKSNAGASDQPQHPLMDDNGDGAGTVGEALSVEPGEDGSRAHELVLGYGVNAPDSVGWITVTPTVTLGPADPVGELFAEPTENPSGHAAWLEVKTPAYAGATVVDPTNPDSQEAVEMPRFDAQYISGGAFCWNTFGTTFDAPGTYKVFYYVKDGNPGRTGEVSTHMMTPVYRELDGNQPPSAVELVCPEDGATVYTTTFFAWSESVDPEGDTVTYRLELAEDSGFTTGLIVKEGILGTVTQLSEADGIVDGESYCWRVIPVDEYGASPASNEVRTFSVSNIVNPNWPGVLVGVIRHSVTEEPIAGATVTVTRDEGTKTTTSLSRGEYYVTNMPADTYTVHVSASGYQSQSQTGVVVHAGESTEANFLLVPDDAPFLWGEVSAEGVVGSYDGSLILQWMKGLIDCFPCDPGIVKPAFPPRADVSGNGFVTQYDASVILRWKVGLIDCFPADQNCDGEGPDGAGKRPVELYPQTTEQTYVMSVPETIIGEPGDEIDVPVMLADASGVFSYYFDLRFDD